MTSPPVYLARAQEAESSHADFAQIALSLFLFCCLAMVLYSMFKHGRGLASTPSETESKSNASVNAGINTAHEDAATEERLYSNALEELITGRTRNGIWAKALAEADGDENRAKANYIKLRVQAEKVFIASQSSASKNYASSTDVNQSSLTSSEVVELKDGVTSLPTWAIWVIVLIAFPVVSLIVRSLLRLTH
jgi:hypothetical protein